MNSVRRHIGFGSTFRFDKIHQMVNKLTDNNGRLAYANYDPSLGEPPTEEQIKLLQEYKTNLPTLTFEGSEKLHGENMAVCFSKDELWVQGRNQIRTLLGDQNGMANFVESTKNIWLKIIQDLSSKYSINTTTHTIVIDCEWAGGNIQKGNAACSGTDKSSYIFDYFRIIDNSTNESEYKSTEGLKVYPDNSIYLMKSFSSYELTLDFNKPHKCEEILSSIVKEVEDHSPIANYFNKPNNVGEGVYLWCEYNGTMLRLKAKGEKHGGKPKQPRKPKISKLPEEVVALELLATKLTPVWRISQAITETNATEKKHLGEVIKWTIADIVKEENLELTKANIEIKDLNRYIAKEIKNYYFDSLG